MLISTFLKITFRDFHSIRDSEGQPLSVSLETASKVKRHHTLLKTKHRATVPSSWITRDDGTFRTWRYPPSFLSITAHTPSPAMGHQLTCPFISLDCTFGSGRVEGDPCTSHLKRALFSKLIKPVHIKNCLPTWKQISQLLCKQTDFSQCSTWCNWYYISNVKCHRIFKKTFSWRRLLIALGRWNKIYLIQHF